MKRITVQINALLDIITHQISTLIYYKNVKNATSYADLVMDHLHMTVYGARVKVGGLKIKMAFVWINALIVISHLQ
jgi:hypothetical protein